MANVKEKAACILKRFPKRQKGIGYIYKTTLPAANKKFKKIVVFSIVVSNEGGVFVRDHTFGFADGGGRTRKGWKIWLDDHYMNVMRDTILDSYQEKYGGFWRLHTLIGWTTHVDKRTRNTKASKKRNKTKRARC